MRKLNLGCGPYPQTGYINIDINIRHKPDVLRDVRKGLPFDTNSIDVVMANHFLEHLYREELLDLIEEIYRVLIPGGIFSFLVPIVLEAQLDHVQIFDKETFDTLSSEDSADYYQRFWNWKLHNKHIEDTNLRQSLKAIK